MTRQLRCQVNRRCGAQSQPKQTSKFRHQKDGNATFPSQVPAIANSNLLTARAAAQFITLNSEFIIARERSQLFPFTIFTPKIFFLASDRAKSCTAARSALKISLIDPDRRRETIQLTLPSPCAVIVHFCADTKTAFSAATLTKHSTYNKNAQKPPLSIVQITARNFLLVIHRTARSTSPNLSSPRQSPPVSFASTPSQCSLCPFLRASCNSSSSSPQNFP
jgi:hypothetical protein